MHRHAETRSLPYSPKQMFDMVADIGSYPEFLPWCLAARVTSRDNGVLSADVVVGKGLFRETFSSKVTLDEGTGDEGTAGEKAGGTDEERPPRIDVDYIKGPMREMANHWVFHPGIDGGTDVEFLVELDFHSRILDTMMGGFFDHAVTRMIDSFLARADVLYGDGS